MSLATIASIVGIGAGGLSIANSLKGGGGGGGAGSGTYVPTGQGGADQAWQDFLKQYSGWANQTAGAVGPQLGQAYGQATAQTPEIQQLYSQLAQLSPQFMQMLMQQAGTAQGAQRGLMGAGDQLYQTALDPQNALRQQMQQQVTDASRAGTSARGIGMGPQAAGLENKAVSDFLINWQNQQLGRQAQGLQGMVGAYGQAGQQGNAVGQNLTGAMGFGQMAPQYLQQGAQWPFQLAGMYSSGMQQGTLNPFTSGMGSIIPYLYAGQGASNQLFGQQQTGLNNLTTGLGQLAQLYQPQPVYPGQGYGTAGSQDPTGGGVLATPY